jgi:hypothetical protein
MPRSSITIRQEGTRVLLIINGRAVADLPWEAAGEVARAMLVQARKAEEIAKHELVAMDHAILLRVGAPFGLAFDPRIRAEGEKAAQWDSSLRRYLPGGVKSQEKFGTPTIIRHPPGRKNHAKPKEL